jgi:broad specificity phosphatase PhoE
MAGGEVRRLIVELVAHMDAGDRAAWRGDQDERPLSDLGRRQAEALAHELGEIDIEAIFASPALRARQTVEPLAAYGGLEVHIIPDLTEKQLGEDRQALERRGVSALDAIRTAVKEGRAVACSHGDLIPATIEALASQSNLPAPEPLEHRAQRYTITFDALGVEIKRVEAGIRP